MVIDRKIWQCKKWQLIPNMTSYIGFRLAYLYLTFTHSKDQGQGHEDFDNVCIANTHIYSKKLLIPWNSKSGVFFLLASLHLTLAHFKSHRQGYAYFDSECLENGELGQNYYCSKIGRRIGFRLSCLHVTWTHYKRQCQDHAYSECKYLENGENKEKLHLPSSIKDSNVEICSLFERWMQWLK